MPASDRSAGARIPPERGRGELVLPGAWRLRLPLPWPGVPHCNAWALATGDELTLVDCGLHGPGTMAQLEQALGDVGLALEQVSRLVCTHAHADHCGQAAAIVARTGCELWLHPDHAHLSEAAADPAAALDRAVQTADEHGVPAGPLHDWAQLRVDAPLGLSGPLEPDHALVDGVALRTDHGEWSVVETPGHAPSHVCLHQGDHRILISGDHLLGRVALYFDFGWTPDPVGEFLASLDRVDALDARIALAGHAKPFADVRAHVEVNRALVAERLAAIDAALAAGPLTAYELVPRIYPTDGTQGTAWRLTKLLCFLTHAEIAGRVRRDGGHPERWMREDSGRQAALGLI